MSYDFLITAILSPVSIPGHVSVVHASYNQKAKLQILRNMPK
jgi:hypothetical protein